MYGEGWFLNLPVLWSVEVQSEFGMAIRFAKDVKTALDLLCQFAHVRWPIGNAVGTISSKYYTIRFSSSVLMSNEQLGLVSSLVALNFQTTLSTISSDLLVAAEYEFVNNPLVYSERLESLISGRVIWGNRDFKIKIPREMLSCPCIMADESSFSLMRRVLRDRADFNNKINDVSILVSNKLSSITRGQITSAQMADAIGMPLRTLERKLAAEGSSFRVLSDRALRDRLVEILGKRNTTAGMAAEILGYHDASSLQRACRRWFGMSFASAKLKIVSRSSKEPQVTISDVS
jgi:AraC-like DNA-binding protein